MTPLLPERRRALSGLLALAVLGTVPFVAAPLGAHEFTGGDLTLLHPNAPPTPPGVTSAAGYLVIVNAGDADDRLIDGHAPFASGIELHRTTVEDDIARMRRLDDGLVIPAGATVRLEPGATHLMFTDLAGALPDGEVRPATLVFERAGPVDVEFAIERPAARGGEPAHATDHGDMGHGDMNRGDMDHGDTDHGNERPERAMSHDGPALDAK